MNEQAQLEPQDLSPDEAIRWAVERIGTLDRGLALTMGQVSAFRYALQCIIAEHPNAESIAARWRSMSPDLVDHEMTASIFQSEDYRAGFQATMALVQRTVDAAAELRSQNPD